MKRMIHMAIVLTAGILTVGGPQIKLGACAESGTKVDSVYGQETVESYEYSMPEIVVVNENARESVKDWAEKEKWCFDQYSQMVYWLGDEYYRDCLAGEKEGNPMAWEAPFEYKVVYEPERMDDSYISLRKYTNVYMGGAHGDLRLTGIVMNALTGDQMELADFLEGQDSCLLAEYIIEQLSAEEKENTASGYGKVFFDGYAETVEYMIDYSPNFFVREDKLIFVFNPYEIAPYVRGDVWVEVPFTALSDLESAVKDKEAAYNRKAFLSMPVDANHYLVEIPAGTVRNVDMNGDGIIEEILFPEDGVDGCNVTLVINRKKYKFFIDENIVEGYIGLTDIDTRDGKYELAVYAYGPSSDRTTTFFSYDGKKLQKIGVIEGIVDRRNITDGRQDLHREYGFFWRSTEDSVFYKKAPAAYLTGDGTVQSEKRIDLPETIWVEGEWKLNEESGRLDYVEKDYYELYNPRDNEREEYPYTLEKDLFLYYEDNKKAGRSVLRKENSRILRFISSDGEKWIFAEVLTEGEIKRGWIWGEDAYKIIENLSWVD